MSLFRASAMGASALTLAVLAWDARGGPGASAVQGPLLALAGDGQLEGELAPFLRRVAPLGLGPDFAGQGVVFNAADDRFQADEQLALPTDTFTVEAWVAVETPRRWGGILGAIEDNGAFEKGWLLGYDNTRFTFGISTEATDDGDGRLVYLRADSEYEIGRWHHVAATYDGEAARLYVDGQLAAESREARGPVLMADSCRLTVGAYRDADELHPHDGRLRDLTFQRGAREEEEIQASAAALARELSGAEPWTDAVFEWTILPYLTWPTANGVSVMAETRTPGHARLEVRAESEAAWTEFLPRLDAAARLHEFVVRGLRTDTKHFYRMSVAQANGGRGESVLTSETRSFRTAPTGDERAFTFTVLSDTQTQGDVAARVSALAFEHRPNFVVHCGDLVDTGSTRTDWTETFFPSMRPLIEHAPLVPVLGNHEQDAQLYYDLMCLPAPERWYSLRYGHAEFFLLDGNRSLADQSEQLTWLQESLAASDATWRFAVLHQPPYTSDSDDYGDTTETTSTRGDVNVQNILGTLERYGVDLCFSGHVHDYERTFPIREGRVVPYGDGGIVYVTAAGAGGSLEDFDPTNTWFGHKKMRRHHFVHVALHGDQLELQAMDENGRLFDVFTLRQRGR